MWSPFSKHALEPSHLVLRTGLQESWAQHGVTFGGNVCFQTDNGNSKGTHGSVWMFGLAHEGRIFSLQFPKPDIRQVDVGRPPLGKTGGLSVRLDPSRLVQMFSLPLLLHSSKILGTLSFGNCFLKSAPVKVLRGSSRPSQSFVWVAAFYATAALQRCFGVGGFDSFPLSSTLGLRAEQLHLFSWRTVCRVIKKETWCTCASHRKEEVLLITPDLIAVLATADSMKRVLEYMLNRRRFRLVQNWEVDWKTTLGEQNSRLRLWSWVTPRKLMCFYGRFPWNALDVVQYSALDK